MLSLHLIAIVLRQFILWVESIIGSLQIERTFDMKLFIKLIGHRLWLTYIYLCTINQTFLVIERHE